MYGALHIIVNNAGVLRDKSFAKMTQEMWDIVYRTHLLGAMSVCKAAWGTMRKQQYGRIVNITSVNGLYGQAGQANYSAAKLGVVGLSKTLAKEVHTHSPKCCLDKHQAHELPTRNRP